MEEAIADQLAKFLSGVEDSDGPVELRAALIRVIGELDETLLDPWQKTALDEQHLTREEWAGELIDATMAAEDAWGQMMMMLCTGGTFAAKPIDEVALMSCRCPIRAMEQATAAAPRQPEPNPDTMPLDEVRAWLDSRGRRIIQRAVSGRWDALLRPYEAHGAPLGLAQNHGNEAAALRALMREVQEQEGEDDAGV